MKKIFLLLAAVGMIFTACEPANGLDEDNNGNQTEQPGSGDQGGEDNPDNPGGGNDDAILTDKIVIKPSTITVEAAANNYIVAVSSPCSWRATTEEDWITLETELGIDGKQQLIFAVKDYWETEPREGKIVVSNSDEGFSAELTVEQKAFVPELEITTTTTSYEYDYKGGEFAIAVTSNFNYNVTTTADWVKCNKDTEGVKISVSVYNFAGNRTAEVKIYSEKYNLEGKTITITQTPPSYLIGTLVTKNGATGIVFYVSDSKVKIVSVKQTYATWSNAKTWCSSYGTGWYLPTLDELRLISNEKSTINSTLSANGYTTLETDRYWSSTEGAGDYAFCLNFYSDGSGSQKKSNRNYVRAILAFEN